MVVGTPVRRHASSDAGAVASVAGTPESFLIVAADLCVRPSPAIT